MKQILQDLKGGQTRVVDVPFTTTTLADWVIKTLARANYAASTTGLTGCLPLLSLAFSIARDRNPRLSVDSLYNSCRGLPAETSLARASSTAGAVRCRPRT